MKLFLKTSAILLSTIFVAPTLMTDDNEQKLLNISYAYPETKEKEKKYLSEYRFEKGYEEAIKYIKDHEGFANGKMYKCVAGYSTIGYGHVVLPEDTFLSQTISRKTADRLVREDFDKAVRAAERETNVTDYKKIAVAHFIFAKGIGNFNRSNFKKLILADKPVDDELKRWCKYKNTKGLYVRSEYSYKIRLWEIEMYNRK